MLVSVYEQIAKPAEVFPYLYLGNMDHATNNSLLKKKKITHILNVSDVPFGCPKDGIEVRHIPLSDFGTTVLKDILVPCFTFIDNAKQKDVRVLVHCVAGVSRSASIVIAYVMKTQKWDLKKSYFYVKKKKDYHISTQFLFSTIDRI